MKKWYEYDEVDNDIVISSRIRLARNLKKYPFLSTISDDDSKRLIEDVKDSIINNSNSIGEFFKFVNFSDISPAEKSSMVENHTISIDALNSKKPSAGLIKTDEAATVLINEEDHIRIQSISKGMNIDSACEFANNLDNLIEERLEYAFDKDLGYLTSCITNTGTGLRASFMIHIPILELSGRLRNISNVISKFGMTLRGIYGEGSEPLGGIYQISNQITLGKSEKEIIEALKKITNQVIEQERELRNEIIKKSAPEFEDRVYRSYGILKHCKKISSKEAMKLLSDIRLGYMMGILKEDKPSTNIYNIMMNIQPGNLIKIYGKNYNEHERDIIRAKYINDKLRRDTYAD